jgi:hypothetical protein
LVFGVMIPRLVGSEKRSANWYFNTFHALQHVDIVSCSSWIGTATPLPLEFTDKPTPGNYRGGEIPCIPLYH